MKRLRFSRVPCRRAKSSARPWMHNDTIWTVHFLAFFRCPDLSWPFLTPFFVFLNFFGTPFLSSISAGTKIGWKKWPSFERRFVLVRQENHYQTGAFRGRTALIKGHFWLQYFFFCILALGNILFFFEDDNWNMLTAWLLPCILLAPRVKSGTPSCRRWDSSSCAFKSERQSPKQTFHLVDDSWYVNSGPPMIEGGCSGQRCACSLEGDKRRDSEARDSLPQQDPLARGHTNVDMALTWHSLSI